MTGQFQSIEHPGPFIKSQVIPAGMTVTQAAKHIGVGLSALSKLLNARARLSSGMAMKIEKAFNSSASDLLAMQSAFDAITGALTVKTAPARTFVPPFAAPKANDIETWANNMKARETLPVLLRQLVHSTCDGLYEVDFPGHDNSQRHGWDGKTKTNIGNPWIPIGISRWEFSTEKNIGQKASKDFAKSIKAIPKNQRLEMTFIFVTPRRWPGKETWKNTQAEKKQWKDVRVLDSSDLEQWLEQSIPAQVWFRNEQGEDYEETRSLEHCWTKWNAPCDQKFTTGIFEEAINAEGKKLLEHLRNPQSGRIFRIAADSIPEGLAFIYAALKGDDPDLHEIRDRVVVFNKPGPLAKLASRNSQFIPVMTNRDIEVELSESGLQAAGISIVTHSIPITEPDITLYPLSGPAFRKALENMGLEGDEISQLKLESGCSLTVLRRRLAPQGHAIRSPEWSTDQTLTQWLFTFMLAGTWESANEADQFILCYLAGLDKYADVERKFNNLSLIESTPVWSAGSFQGVISKIDAFYAIYNAVTGSDLKRFYEIADLVLSERDPALDLPAENRWTADIYGKTRDISPALREGIADSLVFLAVHGNKLFKSRLNINTQHEANNLVRKLFSPMDSDTIESQSDAFHYYAEAAPEEFLNIIESDLQENIPALHVLMRPAIDTFFSKKPRVGLLWALDLLAWSPDLLHRVVEVLAQVSNMEPKDRGNSAMQSLLSIFRSWKPQTSANVEQRIAVFDQLVKKHPEIAWVIGHRQYNRRSGMAFDGIKPRWRDYALSSGRIVTRKESFEFEMYCVKTALSWPDMNREKLSDLIDSLALFDDDYQVRVWQRVIEWTETSTATDQERTSLRNKIRTEINLNARRMINSSVPKTDVDAKINKAKCIYDILKPKDMVWEHAWLFTIGRIEDSWDDIHKDPYDFDASDQRIGAQRASAVREIIMAEGNSGIIRLASLCETPYIAGNTLAQVLNMEFEQLAFMRQVVNESEFLINWNLQSLLSGLLFTLGTKQSATLVGLLKKELNDDQLVKILCSCQLGMDIWNIVETSSKQVTEGYWSEQTIIRLRQSKEELRYAVTQLIKVNRGLAALKLVHLDLKNIDSERIYEILKILPESDEVKKGPSSIDGHSIRKAFKVLNARREIERKKMIDLEFLYLGILQHDREGIANIEEEIDDDPSLFCEAVSIAYKGKNDHPDRKLTNEEKQAIDNTYRFFRALRSIPGLGAGDPNKAAKNLKEWITSARQISDVTGHRKGLDYKFGELLAHAPSAEDGTWPCKPVCKAINDMHSPELERGFTIGCYNARGTFIIGEGSHHEHELAEQYKTWAKACESDYPRMASLLRKMVERYQGEADWQDIQTILHRRLYN